MQPTKVSLQKNAAKGEHDAPFLPREVSMHAMEISLALSSCALEVAILAAIFNQEPIYIRLSNISSMADPIPARAAVLGSADQLAHILQPLDDIDR